WLLRLLQKDPGQRFRSAAEAAWSLERLGEAPGDEAADVSVPEHSTDPAMHGPPVLVTPEDVRTSHFLAEPPPRITPAEAGASAVQLAPRPAPPLPRTWARQRWQG